jgi:hypothetical protein
MSTPGGGRYASESPTRSGDRLFGWQELYPQVRLVSPHDATLANRAAEQKGEFARYLVRPGCEQPRTGLRNIDERA